MEVVVSFAPETDAALHLRASQLGVSVEEFVLKAAEQQLLTKPLDPRITAALKVLEPLHGQLPTLPDEAFDREEIYGAR
jgi:hypothetical protein